MAFSALVALLRHRILFSPHPGAFDRFLLLQQGLNRSRCGNRRQHKSSSRAKRRTHWSNNNPHHKPNSDYRWTTVWGYTSPGFRRNIRNYRRCNSNKIFEIIIQLILKGLQYWECQSMFLHYYNAVIPMNGEQPS